MRTIPPYSVLHLHSEGATAITHKARPDGSLAPHFFYQSPKATGSLEMALKRFFEDSKKDQLYINVVSETPSLKSFKDTALLKESEAFSQVLEAHSGIPAKDCDAMFLNSTTGGEFDGSGPLLVNCFKRSEFLRAQAISSELGFENFELFNNTLSTLGAISDWRQEFGNNESVAILEVGHSSSVATVSLSDGQILSKQIPVSIQDLAESIQKKLELKFESAALLLFYNGVFDFSQHKADISAAFAELLNPHIQNIAGQLGSEVERLLIASLPPSYAWINQEVPQSIALKGFSAEEFYFLKDLSSLGECGSNPGFVGTAFCAHTQSGSHPWMHPLQMQSIEVACKLYQAYAQSQAPAQAPQETTLPQNPSQSQEIPSSQEPLNIEAELPEITEPLITSEDDTPTIEIAETRTPIAEEEEYNPLQPTPQPEPSVNDIFGDSEVQEIIIDDDDPIEVISYDDPEEFTPEPTKVEKAQSTKEKNGDEEEKKSKLGLIITAIAAMLILGVGTYFFFQDSQQAAAPVPLPTDVASVTVEPTQIIKEPTLAKAEEPVHPLSPTPREKAPVEEPVELFELADSGPVIQEAIPTKPIEPVLPMGSLVIQSEPTGASIAVNGETKGNTPVSMDELEFGQYTIEYKLDGYVSELLNITVDSEEPTTVSTDLKLPLGTIEVHTTPEGVDFQIVSVSGLDRVIHSGTTPATVPDVLEGEYDIQFTRATWEDYSEPVVVRHAEVSRVDMVYPEGWVMITSNPDQAFVFEKGTFIGKTPLRLKGLKEGTKHYTLRMEGYEDLEVATEVVAQSEKKLEGELLSWDREVNYSQLDIPPTQTKRGLSNTQRLIGKNAHRFLVEFVINKEGVPEQIEVLETTYLRAHDRLLKDISKWVFEPGMRKDHAVKTRVRLPIILGDVSKLPPTVELARVDNEDE